MLASVALNCSRDEAGLAAGMDCSKAAYKTKKSENSKVFGGPHTHLGWEGPISDRWCGPRHLEIRRDFLNTDCLFASLSQHCHSMPRTPLQSCDIESFWECPFLPVFVFGLLCCNKLCTMPQLSFHGRPLSCRSVFCGCLSWYGKAPFRNKVSAFQEPNEPLALLCSCIDISLNIDRKISLFPSLSLSLSLYIYIYIVR